MSKRYKKLKAFIDTELPQAAVLVVGDVMLDKYYFGEVKKISAEAPVPVTRVTQEKETLGGAANVAHNLALLGCKTLLAGVTGADEHRRRLLQLLADRNIEYEGLKIKAGPTTAKLRVIGGHQQMLRLDFEETEPVGAVVEEELYRYVVKAVQEHQVGSVIISDYAKGVCTPHLCQEIIRYCTAEKIPVIVDPKGSSWGKYSTASYITPNLKELNEACHAHIENENESIRRAAQQIRRKFHIQNLLVTRSEQGLSLIGSRRAVHIPTHAQEVFDVSGAGDTVIAVLAAAISRNLEAADAAFLANLAAGVVVGKVGTYAIHRSELLAALDQIE
jgi:D-beta-D-heptose 7-phosphate kinase/D-beta-D-heptose 1-phosphate adenosyltransferase